MAVPDYQTMMLPVLTLAGAGNDHSLTEVIEAITRQFDLSAEEVTERLPSGRQRTLYNRVGWARTYLVKAGLLTITGRGTFRITDRGREMLATAPTAISDAILMQFVEFADFKAPRTPVAKSAVDKDGLAAPAALDPDEALERSYQTLRQVLAQDLLQRVKSCTPSFFEQLVVDLLVAMGYGGSRKDAARAVGRAGDGGIDGVIKEDRLGLDVVYVQAKRWDASVGRPIVQAFAGSLEGFKARKGVLITTSKFSQDAHDYVTRIEKRIVLVDGEQLAQLMIDHGVAVNEVANYSVKRIDLDYFTGGA
jgi:restriction system protein